MWNNDHQTVILSPCKGFSTPSPASSSDLKASYCSMAAPTSETKRRSPANRGDLFHVIHKVPAGNSPYVRAKEVQLIEKDPSRAISLFWSAINAGDRVDSALKDMAIVMKQLNRSDEAIEAIKSFRHLCPHDSQESLDNVLVELYKRAGRIDEEIEMLQNKLKRIEEGTAFGGRRTKTARSQGKKVYITIEEEKSRILGNLAWAYLQQNNYKTAEEYYRKALVLEPDKNKKCNLAICLMHMNKIDEAKSLLHAVKASCGRNLMDESYSKSFERACEILSNLETESVLEPVKDGNSGQEMPKSSPFPMVVPRRWEGRRQREDTDRVMGRHKEFYCSNNFESKANSKGKDKIVALEERSSPRISSGQGNSLKHSQQAVAIQELRNGCFNGNLGKRGSSFTDVKKYRAGTSGTEPQASSWHRKTYFSPSPAWCKERTPFTQPRRCLWGFSDGNQRKIVFAYPKKNFSPDEDWRIKTSWENSDLKESTSEECNLNQGLLTSESQNGQSTTETPKPTIDLSVCCKKSWADMAEEDDDEDELCKTATEFFNGSQNFEFNGSLCLQTQMKNEDHGFEFYNNLNTEERFNDENTNCNVAHKSPYLQTQMKNVARKLKLCDLREEYFSSPINDASSRNQPVRRSLCFDHHQKPGYPIDYNYFCASPLPRKSLNYDGSNFVQSKGKGLVPGKNIRLMRRNRLKVFQDITRSP